MLFGTTISLSDLMLWVFAGVMAYAVSILIKWTVRARTRKAPIDTPFIIFILIMMLAMVVSAVVYFLSPSTGVLLDLVVINMFVMSAGILPILLVMSLKLSTDSLEGEEQAALVGQAGNLVTAAATRSKTEGGRYQTLIVLALAILNEFFMGWALVLASGTAIVGGSADPLSLFASVVNSYWFVFTMAGEMILTTFFLRSEINRTLFFVIAFQSAIMFLSPTAITDPSWVQFCVYGASTLMTVLFIYLFDHFARNNTIDNGFAEYLSFLLIIYSGMMAGLFVWELYGSGFLFSLSLIAEMILYFRLILNRRERPDFAAKKSWLVDPKWIFGIISTIFVSEYFMGGLLDVATYGKTSFLASLNLSPISGNFASAFGSTMYDFIAWFGGVTGSTWFLIMMGIEMGALVIFKISTARELETKIRLGLVVLAYAIYTILVPMFLISKSAIPTVPFVGWSMGVGTSGAFAPSLLIAIIGTYVVSGMLSFLFGSRQMCSMFCTAALMYQGTFYDKMKTFNRSSKIGRKFLTSKLSNGYRAIFSIVWVSVFATVLLSYFDSIGILHFSIFGNDPVAFFYTFYFNFLWYLIFITIPFVGTYGCVSMGWCQWGSFNQLVSRLGFFKLKVKDTDTCLNCKTKDCAQACPVGLTDLPSKFISSGQFKSHKCIGVGDCVSSCPYENIQFHDIRHWVKAKSGNKKDSRPQLIQLRELTRIQDESIN